MVLTVKYKDGIRERKRAIVNVCAINYVEGADKLKITTNNTGKERFELKGEEFEFNLSKESLKQMDKEHSNGWIPFTQRELTEEEKEYYAEDVKYMLDCKLPEEDEEILVTSKFKDELYVSTDTFMRDGSMCYLDSGRDLITEVIAWQPLPEPYKGVPDDRT